MMGEFQISNLPLIIIAIVIISIGVLGYFEIKKLYIKLNSITTKIDEINDMLPKNQPGMPRQMQPPPHIIEQQRMMMQKQKMMQQHQQQQMKMKHAMNNMEMSEELKIPEDQNDNDNKDLEDDINHEDYSDDNTSYDDDDDIKSSNAGDDIDDEENPSEVGSKKSSVLGDITNLSDHSQSHHSHSHHSHQSYTSEMTIELDNEFKHLSVKELKELCQENNLPVSGNKSKLISRLLENKNSSN